MRDAHGLLIRALERAADGLTICSAVTRSWASATFTGGRHEFIVMLTTEDGTAKLQEELAEIEFTLPGHLVADIVATAIDSLTLRVEALTIENV